MSMARAPLPGVETKGSNATSGTFGLKDVTSPTSMSNTQKHILQIIRKEEDHLMSLLAASPLLSSLFLAYANGATAPDNPPIPSPIDQELLEMKALNHRLQEEVASLRDQLTKGTDRAREAQDCIEALRARLSSVEDTNRDLEAAVLDERAKVKAIISEYADYKKETTDTIAELHNAMNKEVDARAAPSQAIGDQQITSELPKEKTKHPSPPPAATQHRPKSGGEREQQRSDVSASEKGEEAVKQTDTREQQDDSQRSADSKPLDDSKQGDCINHPDEKERKDTHGDPKESIKPAYDSTSVQNVKQSPWKGRKLQPFTSEYADYKKEATGTIAKLHNAMDKEVDARAAQSQAIGDQQMTSELPKEKTKHPSPPPAATQHRPKSGGEREQQQSNVSTSEKGEEAVKQADTRKQQGDSERSADTKPRDDSKQGDCIDHPDEKKQRDTHGDPKESIKPAHGSASVQSVKQSPLEGRKLQPASIWFRGVQARRQRDVA